MKKISIIATILTALTLGVTSCDMNLRPLGKLEPENAFISPSDAESFHVGFYQALLGRVGGSQIYLTELQSDLFHATTGYGNRGGNMYNWVFTVSDGDIQGRFSSPYSAIANCNYFLENANKVDKTTEAWAEAGAIENLNVWKGEAFFLRAFYHMQLVEKFCLDYPGNEQSYGIPYVTVYNPTSDQTLYPERGTLQNTIEHINSDLDSAEILLTTPGSVGSMYLTADVVKAFRARVALYTGDYQSAIRYSSSLIASGTYPLINGDATAFNNLWVNDSGQECIMQLWSDINNWTSNVYGYIGYNTDAQTYGPDFIPEQWVVDLYDEADLRFGQFLKNVVITMPGPAEHNVYILFKFPGNPELKSNPAEYNGAQKPKPFRIAEQYLILAEAYARSGNEAEARNVLNDLRAARYPGYNGQYTEGDILTEILNERTRELIGEGFRLGDLRRFKVDLRRGDAQDEAAIIFPHNNVGFHRSYTDHRFVWPIPQEEIDANPNLAGQQNEGYN